MTSTPFKKPKLFLLILVMPGILWCSVLGAGFQGLMTIRDNQEIARQDREQLSLGVEAIDRVGAMQYHFKLQVQAWKNILLRGADPDRRAEYVEKFAVQSRLIQHFLEQLPDHFRRLGLDAVVVQQVNVLQEQHHLLETHYRAALQIFVDQLAAKASAGEAVSAADHAVMGQDAAISEQTEQLASVLSDHVKWLVKRAGERDDAWFSQEIVHVAQVLVGLGLVLLPLSFFVVRNYVIRPITRMSTAIERVANGDLTQRVATQNIDELRACEFFNYPKHQTQTILF